MEKLSLSHLTFRFDLKRCLLKGAASDGDLARFHSLGHFTLQRNRENTIRQRGILDPDVIGELEAAFKCAPGDAAMQIFAVLPFGLLPLHQKDVPLLGDVQVTFGEAATAI